jgi:Na+/H+ antiporter NhaD/arsenite permease-like protein
MEWVQTLAGWQVTAALIIFILTFALIVTGAVNRTYAALGGAVLMLLLGIVTVGSVYRLLIVWQTIELLIGLMILIGITSRTGLFSFAAVKIAQMTKGRPRIIFILLAGMAALGAAWLDNLSAILLLVPITLTIARGLQLSPVPFVIAITLSANMGGTATLIGSLPNMLIGTTAGLTFNDFLRNLVPPVLITWVVSLLLLNLFYAKSWTNSRVQAKELVVMDPASFIKDKPLIYKVISVWVLVIAANLLQPLLRVDVAHIALAGALALILLTLNKRWWEDMKQSVDWHSFIYIIALFIVVGGMSSAGFVHLLSVKAMELTSGNLLFTSLLILWITGIVSATMDSIPFILFMIPLIKEIGVQSQGAMHPLWWSLALGAGLGGSGTLLGATANLVAAGLADRDGHRITFSAFLKVGAPLTLLSLLIASAFVMYVY